VRWRLVGALAAAVACAAAPARAQVLRGTVRVQNTDRVVPGVRIGAMDSAGTMLAEVVSDETGRFVLAFSTTLAIRIVTRKVGVAPALSSYLRMTPADTLQVDLWVPSDTPELPSVKVEGEKRKTPNELAYEEAVRRGWMVFGPAKLAEQRGRFREFTDLLRALQVPGIRLGRPGECIQSTRHINRCLAIVIDDVPVGPYATVVPTDISFIAVLSASDASVRWGNRAPWGAVAVYTRMFGEPGKP
jgi:hypothetical protein